jgi:hypothetical protein
MKYTLLDMVQIIGSSLDSDEINSIGDSVESMQIATIVKTSYYDIIERNNLPEHFDLVNLQSSADTAMPVVMYVPTDVSKVYWVKYNKATTDEPDLNMQELQYTSLEDFLKMTYELTPSDAEVFQMDMTINGNTIPILYRNDKHPEYYTSFDDKTFIFDSYDAAEDSYLVSNKTLAAAKMSIVFNMTDDFIPDLDESQFTLLLNEAKSLAWLELRQTQHPKAEINAKRAWQNAQISKVRVPGVRDLDKLPDFGRRRY